MKYLLVLILVVSFSSCTNYDEKMRKFDASFTKMRKITSANVLNHELILGDHILFIMLIHRLLSMMI